MKYLATTSNGLEEYHDTLITALQELAVLMAGDASPLGTIHLLTIERHLKAKTLIATIAIDTTAPLAKPFDLSAMQAEHMAGAA